ncbi:Uncharacterised protein [Enterobacter cancerogenus]|uniref:Uncharacterized protein n=1 Tax=Enterobacter cancerogenus TaxID=69218 RepID=A0A484YWR7_9ENTR|nr:Uncharacterised protein [Enterobacter cancerogenus]
MRRIISVSPTPQALAAADPLALKALGMPGKKGGIVDSSRPVGGGR